MADNSNKTELSSSPESEKETIPKNKAENIIKEKSLGKMEKSSPRKKQTWNILRLRPPNLGDDRRAAGMPSHASKEYQSRNNHWYLRYLR